MKILDNPINRGNLYIGQSEQQRDKYRTTSTTEVIYILNNQNSMKIPDNPNNGGNLYTEQPKQYENTGQPKQ